MAAEQNPGYIPPGRLWKRTRYPREKLKRETVQCVGTVTYGKHTACTNTFLKLTPAHTHCRVCSGIQDIESKRLRRQKARDEDNARKAVIHKSLRTPREITHGNQYSGKPELRKAQPKCPQCAELSERRPHAPEKCRCGFSWSADKIERGEVLHSSAWGTFARNYSR